MVLEILKWIGLTIVGFWAVILLWFLWVWSDFCRHPEKYEEDYHRGGY